MPPPVMGAVIHCTESPEIEAPILFEDEALLVLNKPAGLLVHRGWGRDRVVLTDLVAAYLGGSVSHPVHRLDRQTSGVVLFAKNRTSASALGQVFDTGRADKVYWALVRGTPADQGTIDHPIPKSEGGPRIAAVTDFKRLATAHTDIRTVSLVEARPRTGRLHQVRRHLKHISHPLIGDANYGKGALNRAMREKYGLQRMALHAGCLSFPHPETGRAVSFTAPIPEDLARPFLEMGFGDALKKLTEFNHRIASTS